MNVRVAGAAGGRRRGVLGAVQAIQDGVYFYATDVPAAGSVRGGLCNLSGVAQVAISSYPVRIVTFR